MQHDPYGTGQITYIRTTSIIVIAHRIGDLRSRAVLDATWGQNYNSYFSVAS